jgi:hypothetical protein
VNLIAYTKETKSVVFFQIEMRKGMDIDDEIFDGLRRVLTAILLLSGTHREGGKDHLKVSIVYCVLQQSRSRRSNFLLSHIKPYKSAVVARTLSLQSLLVRSII